MKTTRVKPFFKTLVGTLYFGFTVGVMTGISITLFKFAASWAIKSSATIYGFLSAKPYFLPVALAAIFGLSFLCEFLYDRCPDSRGGGIPTAVAIVRGIIGFRWVRNLFAVLFSSLLTFVIGVPLGNEGPCVQAGVALSRGIVFASGRKYAGWNRYAMTGGAASGFAVATSAPVAGILFAVEEAHRRFSPVVIGVTLFSVTFSTITARLLSPLLGVKTELFSVVPSGVFPSSALWVPVVVAIIIAAASIFALKLYPLIDKLFTEKLKSLRTALKMSGVFAVTLALGTWSFSLISTGHSLIESALSGKAVWWFLLVAVVLRFFLTACANVTGITGGLFIPSLALGAAIGSLTGQLLFAAGAIPTEYVSVCVTLGMTACLAGFMKMPLTAIAFSLEALGGTSNVTAVILTVSIAYAIVEFTGAKSINDAVIAAKTDRLHAGKKPTVTDTFVTVLPKSFVVGKEIKDVLWPNNLIVLSIKHSSESGAVMDVDGEKLIREGDVLHVRYSTYDERFTTDELVSLIGYQQINGREIKRV